VKDASQPQELHLFASSNGTGTPLFTFPNIASITGGEGVVLPNVKLVDDGHGARWSRATGAAPASAPSEATSRSNACPSATR
jgi:hypothetical protein